MSDNLKDRVAEYKRLMEASLAGESDAIGKMLMEDGWTFASAKFLSKAPDMARDAVELLAEVREYERRRADWVIEYEALSKKAEAERDRYREVLEEVDVKLSDVYHAQPAERFTHIVPIRRIVAQALQDTTPKEGHDER